MKVLLLGADGQVGHELRGPLSTFAELVAATRATCDLTDLAAVRALVRSASPDVIVNTVAYNEVDKAEADREGAMRLNAELVALLGEEAKAGRGALITYSTDFVFDGEGTHPYREDDPARPLSTYGASKLAGERALLEDDAPALIFRTAWVWSLRRKSFVSTILRAARERETLKIVDDQIGNPTFARDLAVATALVLYGVRKDPHAGIAEARGVYHVAGSGFTSRHAFALAALELDPKKSEHVVKSVEAVPTSAFPTPARRPKHAPLDGSKAAAQLGITMPHWRDALARAFAGS